MSLKTFQVIGLNMFFSFGLAGECGGGSGALQELSFLLHISHASSEGCATMHISRSKLLEIKRSLNVGAKTKLLTGFILGGWMGGSCAHFQQYWKTHSFFMQHFSALLVTYSPVHLYFICIVFTLTTQPCGQQTPVLQCCKSAIKWFLTPRESTVLRGRPLPSCGYHILSNSHHGK